MRYLTTLSLAALLAAPLAAQAQTSSGPSGSHEDMTRTNPTANPNSPAVMAPADQMGISGTPAISGGTKVEMDSSTDVSPRHGLIKHSKNHKNRSMSGSKTPRTTTGRNTPSDGTGTMMDQSNGASTSTNSPSGSDSGSEGGR